MDFIKNISIDKVRNAAEDVINQARPRNDVEARVYQALSHKNWGSSSTLMNEIASDTFEYDRYHIISKILWESLQNKRPAAWRVVFKALTLLEHLIKNGSERCVDEARGHSHVLRSLFNFNYYEGTTDRGVGVREKSKQLVEILSDDERIREERQKARQLREKFGGNLGGVGSAGSIGGGGGGRYTGYGNDSSAGAYNGSSGYGNSGIGSSSYADGGIGSSTGDRYSGRYDTNETSSPSKDEKDDSADAPTFAALPEKKVKKKKKSSKKKKEKSADAEVAAPTVDLFDLSEPTPEAGGDDDFNAFQDAGGSAVDATNNESSFDAFGEMASASVQKDSSFDAFGEMAVASTQKNTDEFDAFGSPVAAPASNPPTQEPSFDMFAPSTGSGNAIPQQQPVVSGNSGMNDMFGNMSIGGGNNVMQQQMSNTQTSFNPNIMGGGKGPQKEEPEDEFGNFEDAEKKSTDPLSNLISLDGLSKNKKNVDRSNEPVVFNSAAQQYVNNKQSGKGPGSTKIAAELAFSGVDGLNKTPESLTSQNSTNRPSGKPIMSSGVSMNSNSSMNIGMMGPASGGIGMMGGSSNSMNSMGGGMMNGTQSFGMNGMGGGNMNNMGGQGMGGMAMNGQSMGGMNGMGGQSMGGMNSMNGMGGQSMGGMNSMNGMGGQSMGGMNSMNSMGGQSMGGMNSMNGMGGQSMGGMNSMNGMGGGQGMGGINAMSGQAGGNW